MTPLTAQPVFREAIQLCGNIPTIPNAHDCMKPSTKEMSKMRMNTSTQSMLSFEIICGIRHRRMLRTAIKAKLRLIVNIGGKYL
mmetsp:Transcript_32145/g.36669  ORF Transcript_32145/g.36669 Transcript_32145/m.36669 type:complete len:84 (-) Transcript_32145:145-396(-)